MNKFIMLASVAVLSGCAGSVVDYASKPLSNEMDYSALHARLGRMKNYCIQEGTPKSQIDACVRQNMIAGDNAILRARGMMREYKDNQQQQNMANAIRQQQILQQQPAPVAVFTQKPQITCDTSGGRYIYCQ